jgi:hypothetical protein
MSELRIDMPEKSVSECEIAKAQTIIPRELFFVRVILVILLIISFMAGIAFAGSFTASKRAGVFLVGIQIDRNPPIIGDNRIEIEIRDASGAIVSDAKVLVNYYMPPMPRMAPMNYRTDAPFRGGKYRMTMSLIMEGPWVIAVKINFAGKTTTAKFNIDVR